MLLELLTDLLLQGDARVKHDTQQANDLQVAVEVGMHLLDGVHQVGDTFQRKVFALHRHDHAVRGAQAVEREHRQRRRAVDQHKIIIDIDLGQRGLQAHLTPLQRYQLDLGTGQLAVGAQHVVATFFSQHGGLAHRSGLDQHVVHRQRKLAFVHARAHGGIALGVQVHHQHTLADLGQAGRQVHRRGGFANAALLVGNTENFGHGAPQVIRVAVTQPQERCSAAVSGRV